MSNTNNPVHHRTARINNVDIFYREAGSPNNPTLLLLHGFPSSSITFRHLINQLKNDYHILAPDFPGFGFSAMPLLTEFNYTFENYSVLLEEFLHVKQVSACHFYLFDYGAPIGMRLIQRKPEILLSLIVQNGNIYDEGLSDRFKQTLKGFDNATEEAKSKTADFFELPYTMFEYLHGVTDSSKIPPETYLLDQYLMNRPGNKEIQYQLKYDYRYNVDEYPKWQETLKRLQPPTLIVWGENDPIFQKEGALAFSKDLPDTAFHFFPTGHFALEEFGEEIAGIILSFLGKN